MSNEQKPREWWIIDSLMSGHVWVSKGQLNPDHQEKESEVHVIEAAPVLKRIAALEAELVGSKRYQDDLTNEMNLLKTALRDLSEALEKVSKATYGTEFIAFTKEEYESNYEIVCRHFFGAQAIAREALTRHAKLLEGVRK